MGDRFGPYKPGASELTKLLDASVAPTGRRGASGRRRRGEPDNEPSEIQARHGAGRRGLPFPLRPGAHTGGTAGPGGSTDRGRGLVDPGAGVGGVGTARGRPCRGCEPHRRGAARRLRGGAASGLPGPGRCAGPGRRARGGVALRALEQGYAVSIVEVADDLAALSSGSLGGLVLSGVVDRLPLHSILLVLSQAHRVLALGAPIVVVATDPAHARAAARRRRRRGSGPADSSRPDVGGPVGPGGLRGRRAAGGSGRGRPGGHRRPHAGLTNCSAQSVVKCID